MILEELHRLSRSNPRFQAGLPGFDSSGINARTIYVLVEQKDFESGDNRPWRGYGTWPIAKKSAAYIWEPGHLYCGL